MCGIAGAIDLKGKRLFAEDRLRAMCAAIAHRGPDDEQICSAPGISLGVRRLAIVDLKGGQQPISNEEGSVWVAFNGELFEHSRLFKELAAKGHRLATRCDTEAWVHLYEDCGEQMFDRAQGQFAVSLWDASARRLILARDRVGICPLFYAERDGWLLWASEIKGLLASGLVSATPDPQGIDHAITFYAIGTTRTAFQEVYSIPPGHYLRVSNGRVRLFQYWDLDFPDRGEERRADDPAMLADELEHLLRQAVRRRLRGDVPVVSYLSGGLDSTLVLALASQESGEPLPAFTIGLDQSGPDERWKAQEAVAHIRCPHIILNMTAHDIADSYPDLTRAAEFPVLATQCACETKLAEVVRKHGYRVALTGEGADEALCGYHHFKLDRFHSWTNWHLGRLGYYASRGGLRIPGRNGRWSRTPFRAMSGVRTARQLTYELWGRCRDAIYSANMWNSLRDHSPFEDLDLTNERIKRWHPLNQACYVEYKTFLPGLPLTAPADRSAMNSSVETRPPFLDEDVVEFCARLHPRYKLRGLTGKWLLRRVAERILPRRIVNRRKQGFSANMSSTFFGPSRPQWTDQLLSPESLRATGYFDPALIARQLARQQRTANRFVLNVHSDVGLTAVITTQLWHHIFCGGGLCELPAWTPPSGVASDRVGTDTAASAPRR